MIVVGRNVNRVTSIAIKMITIDKGVYAAVIVVRAFVESGTPQIPLDEASMAVRDGADRMAKLHTCLFDSSYTHRGIVIRETASVGIRARHRNHAASPRIGFAHLAVRAREMAAGARMEGWTRVSRRGVREVTSAWTAFADAWSVNTGQTSAFASR